MIKDEKNAESSAALNRFFRFPERPVAILASYITALTMIYSALSGPAKALGLGEALVTVNPALSRAGRVIMVYHTLAVPFIALLAILFVSMITLKESRRNAIVHSLIFGSLTSSMAGFIFAYQNGGMIAHGVFIFGLSIVFYGGLNLAIAVAEIDKHQLEILEMTIFEKWAMTICFFATLISAALGGIAGSFFGSGFEAFLAEDAIRAEHNILQLAVISHLHIMLALLAIALVLLMARYYRLSGLAGQIFFVLMIIGTTITSIATWSVLIIDFAHKIINVGAFFLLSAAMIFSFKAFKKMIHGGLFSSFRAVIFSFLFLVNLFVTVPGIYVAINLEKFRTVEYAEIERTFAVGHWHILGSIVALIAVLFIADYLDLKDKLTNVAGWLAGAGGVGSFTGALIYIFKAPGQNKSHAMYLIEPSIAIFMLSVAVLIVSIARRAFMQPFKSWNCVKSEDFTL